MSHDASRRTPRTRKPNERTDDVTSRRAHLRRNHPLDDGSEDLVRTNDDARDRPVTVVGLGAMGSALAAAVLRAGHPTTVWNRSAEKAQALADAGA